MTLGLQLKLLSTQIDEGSLSILGEDACSMLMRRDYYVLANRFGYALAYDREPAVAIETDFLGTVASPYNVAVAAEERPSVAVKYFGPNSAGLFAIVECSVPVAEGAAILLELVVSRKGEDRYIIVEDISGANV